MEVAVVAKAADNHAVTHNSCSTTRVLPCNLTCATLACMCLVSSENWLATPKISDFRRERRRRREEKKIRRREVEGRGGEEAGARERWRGRRKKRGGGGG